MALAQFEKNESPDQKVYRIALYFVLGNKAWFGKQNLLGGLQRQAQGAQR
jgi:hypothetical protein